jgi:hypothetical protein
VTPPLGAALVKEDGRSRVRATESLVEVSSIALDDGAIEDLDHADAGE